MDFRRVEGIFLVVFLFLNIFLFYIYQEGKVESETAVSGTISDRIEQRLVADEIDYPEKLSIDKQEGYYLSASEVELKPLATKDLNNQEWYIENNRLYSKVFSSIQSSDAESFDGAKAFVKHEGNVIEGNKYYLNKNRSKMNKEYYFSQKWENIPFLDETSALVLKAKKNQLNQVVFDSYEQTMLADDVEPLREKQLLISEREAIISLYTNNRLQPKSDIKWIELGYSRMFTVRGRSVFIPTWFVDVSVNKNNSQVERVNAFTGGILSSNVSEVKN
ncbi:two-component system regulatory protein YycI [Vagococcus silagei]|uniref:Regulatory protein YycH-like domain-containing protein n=1 Tax=Vagococcus silagei TaxID=2508885 RepID=A0A4S3B2Y2_9ENTE|nr:two-component system regulatory protein YycI [Vagococcus silagei]THB60778.1 hypothetical protein ESZ54_07355 [Vagococcus silagei]